MSHINMGQVTTSKIKSGLKLNIGCGETTLPGYINLDKCAKLNIDLIWDLEKIPLPFKTNSVDEIRAEHVLEHITNFMPLMEELYRIAKPNAIIKIICPYFKYEGAYRDPTHVRFFTEHSFDYFQDNVKFCHYSNARFRVQKVERRVRHMSSVVNNQKKFLKHIPNFMRPVLATFFWNIYTEIDYTLEVIK